MSDTSVPHELYRLMEELVNDNIKLPIFAFICDHPYMEFAKGAITPRSNRSDVARSLEQMTEMGILSAHTEKGVTFYTLTPEKETRAHVLQLGTIDRGHWRLGFKGPASRDRGLVGTMNGDILCS